MSTKVQGGRPEAAQGSDLDRNGGAGTTSVRRLRRRPGLPGSRSVVGGLLVAVAVVGTWWVAGGHRSGPTARYVVATRAVGPGEVLEPDALATRAVDLPASVAAHAFLDPGVLEGAVALGPLAPGELVQVGAVAPPAARRRVVSFSIDRDWAVAGTVQAGDRIDVYASATAGSGSAEAGSSGETSAAARRILRRATVQAVEDGDGGLGADGRQVITVILDADVDAGALVATARTGDLTVVRVTGTGADADRGTGGGR